MKKKENTFALPFLLLIFVFIPPHAVARKKNSHLSQPAVELTVIDSSGFTIPENFTGISFETDAALPNHRGVQGYLFSSANKQLITLFINSGIRSLRIGGSTVDKYHEAAHNRTAIDSVFSFAKAVGIKVIYSLPLLNADATADAVTAKYIWTYYKDLLDCFSIGNEPNCPPFKEATVGTIKSYEEYLPIWQKFAATVVEAVPDAKFTGPDAGGWNWTEEFALDEKSSGLITSITHHQYPGGRPVIDEENTPMPAMQAIDNMLSPQWLTGEYLMIYSRTGEKVHPYGFRCRMTEANDYLGGIAGASNAMSSALWALDYMHWQAVRGLSGINFHNNQWLKTCTIYMGSSGEYLANPKAHAIRAFDLVSGGCTKPVEVSNPEDVNLTAYAVKGDRYLYVTVINKEHGSQARNVQATISAKGFTKGKVEAMFLLAPGNNAGATSGITLGGDSITNNRPWQGKWTALKGKNKGRYDVNVAETSAVIVRIPVR
ncbi:MAG: hypothetical protein LBC19_08100 [Tannerella sp.]|jgi:hypothetical protein|nr:hypothetical protein [Tannerella sp.]